MILGNWLIGSCWVQVIHSTIVKKQLHQQCSAYLLDVEGISAESRGSEGEGDQNHFLFLAYMNIY